MSYPRKVIIENPKLEKLILEKESLVLEGRKISEEIEQLEAQMESIDTEIQEQEKKVDISDLNDEASAITEEFNTVVAKMDDIKSRIYDRMKEIVDPKVKEQYEKTKKMKEDLETKRNKVALNVQKRRDKIIPLAQKAMEDHLEDKYEDYNSIMIEDGKVVGTIFNHKEDWEKSFKKR